MTTHHPTQLLITAETPAEVAATMSKRALSDHLRELAAVSMDEALLGPHIAYSQRPGNGGYTGFIAGAHAHVDFHHWDGPVPGVLQLDVFTTSEFEESAVLDVLHRTWDCQVVSAASVTRSETEGAELQRVYAGDSNFSLDERPGMGPGDHVHLMITTTSIGDITAGHTRADLKRFLNKLVSIIGMTIIIHPRIRILRREHETYVVGLVGITTSHLSLHFATGPSGSILHLDVFSCSPFHARSVVSYVEHHFACRVSSAATLTRYPASELSIIRHAHG